jgi:hypothetical protein
VAKVKVIEHVAACLEVQNAEMGKVYRGCKRRLLSVVPVVSIRVEDGYKARCLLCGTNGPVRGNGEIVRRVLLEQLARDEE